MYVDAAKYDEETAALVVTTREGDIIDCITMRNTTTKHAETGALLLAIRWGERNGRGLNIITDSQAAVRMLAAGRIPLALRKVLPESLEKVHNITWTPGHEGLPGNEAANRRACDFTHHPPVTDALRYPSTTTYGEYLQNTRKERATYPIPHRELTASEAQMLRKIQTNTFIHKSRWAKIFQQRHPDYTEDCRLCGETATLFHATWACPHLWAGAEHQKNPPLTSRESWEAALASPDLQIQKDLISRAKTGAEATGALDKGFHL